jgi:hypothetical protein
MVALALLLGAAAMGRGRQFVFDFVPFLLLRASTTLWDVLCGLAYVAVAASVVQRFKPPGAALLLADRAEGSLRPPRPAS